MLKLQLMILQQMLNINKLEESKTLILELDHKITIKTKLN